MIGDFSFDGGYVVVMKFLKKGKVVLGFSVVFCVNDVMVMVVIFFFG